jgi:hypothetical protein
MRGRFPSRAALEWRRMLDLVRLALCTAAILAMASEAYAGERYALIVSGASGGAQYAQRYDGWRDAIVSLLRDQFGYPADRMHVLADSQLPNIRKPTRENVRAALGDLRQRARADDVVLVMLIGHGSSSDIDESKFNLVGPDLTAVEWADLLKPIAGRLVFVDTTGGSFPFLRTLAAPGRIVLTATDSPGQVFETVFPEFFIHALADSAADGDKNQKVSIWEAFEFAGAGVKNWFAERGQVATERPAIDDSGRGENEGASSTRQSSLARITYLQPDVRIPPTADAELARLLKRRAEIESTVERLRLDKASLPPEKYERQLEELLLEMARLDRQIRARS